MTATGWALGAILTGALGCNLSSTVGQNDPVGGGGGGNGEGASADGGGGAPSSGGGNPDGSNGNGGNGNGGSAVGGNDTGGGGGGAPQVCNAVANTAVVEPLMIANEYLPTSYSGGTVLDGTYELTAIVDYGGPGAQPGPDGSGAAFQETCVVQSNVWDCVSTVTANDFGPETSTYSVTMTPTNSTLAILYTCGDGQSGGGSFFTANGSEVSIGTPSANGSGEGLSWVYTRQ